MRAFTTLAGMAAPLPLSNVDTDKILPGAYLKTLTREGLGKWLFAALRYHDDGTERKDFILNRMPWRNATILVAHDNFGCGSSREHAPWALMDFGIRCIIAPRFADIFRHNCLKNGILPITLPSNVVGMLVEDASVAQTASLAVDLPGQTITRNDGSVIAFGIDPDHKTALLGGLDDIEQSLNCTPQIEAFEVEAARIAPWIYSGIGDRLANVLGAQSNPRRTTT